MPPILIGRAAGSRPRGDSETWRRYGEYLRRPPVLSLEWCDQETGAHGWLVINTLRGGAAGGGTRMRAGLSRREVVYLAKTMELKFLFSGPPIGGAKSGIDFDPSDARRPQVLRRWFNAIGPQLHRCYGTGGDLNVDEVLDVIPCCREIGLSHPQEGVVRGHLGASGGELTAALERLDHGVSAPVIGVHGLPGAALAVADLITGYGVSRSIAHLYHQRGQTLAGARVVIEGFGAVGGPCAMYLARSGARIVALADREKVLIEPDGLTSAEIDGLVRRRADKCIPADDPRCADGRDRSSFHSVPADVFVSAAASGTLDDARVAGLAAQGVSTIVCGANQPFREAKLGATRVQRLADSSFTIIPDVVANCGMARAFSYLMESPGSSDPGPMFEAVDDTIGRAVAQITDRADGRPTGLLAATLDYALDRIDADH